MKNKILKVGLAALAVVSLAGCSKKEEEVTPVEENPVVEKVDEETPDVAEEKSVLSSEWAEAASPADVPVVAGFEAETGELEGYTKSLYCMEGGIAAVYTDEAGDVIVAKKLVADSDEATTLTVEKDNYVLNEESMAGETAVTLLGTAEDVVSLVMWEGAEASEDGEATNFVYAVSSTLGIADADLEAMVGLIK